MELSAHLERHEALIHHLGAHVETLNAAVFAFALASRNPELTVLFDRGAEFAMANAQTMNHPDEYLEELQRCMDRMRAALLAAVGPPP